MISVIYFKNSDVKEAKNLKTQTYEDFEIFYVPVDDLKKRNQALKECNGEYITFVSAKDKVADDFFEYLIMGMSKSHMSVCGYDICEADEVLYETPEGTKRLLTGEEMQCRIYYQYHFQGYLQNKMFRRQIIASKKISFAEDLEENYDFLFLMQYLRYAKFVRMLPEIKYHFLPYAGLKRDKRKESDLKISETDSYLRCLKELPKRSDAYWLGEQTAAGSALVAYESMEAEAYKSQNFELFLKSPMKKMAKKCLKLEYEIEDEEEERLFLGLLEYSKTGRISL